MKLLDRLMARLGYVPLNDFIALQHQWTALAMWRRQHEQDARSALVEKMVNMQAMVYVDAEGHYWPLLGRTSQGTPCS